MYSILKRFSVLFIILTIISLICSACLLIFLAETELQLFDSLKEAPYAFFSLIFTVFTGPILFACLAVVFRSLRKDLENTDYQISKRINELK